MNKKTKPTAKLSNANKLHARIKSVIVIVIVAAIGTALLIATKAATGPATLSMSPNSGSRAKDSTFAVSMYADSKGQDINAFTFKLNYDQAKLQPTGAKVDVSNSQFSGCAENSTGGGVIKLTCFVTGEVFNTRQQVGTVTFKVLAGSGSTALSFGGDSQISEAGTGANLWDGATDAGSFGLTTPSSPSPAPTPNPKPSPAAPAAPSTPKPSTGGSSPAPSSTTGGTSNSGGGAAARGGGASLPNTGAPVVTTPDPNSNQPQITGIIAITLTDKDGKPATGVTVKLGKLEAVTDALGVASFVGVSPGKHKVTAKSRVLGAISKDITVGEQANVAQEFKLQLKKRPNYLLFALIALGVMVVVTGVLFLKRRLRQKADQDRHFIHARNSTAAVPAALEPANNSIATLITPHSKESDEAIEKEALEKLKPKVEATDTLEEIEHKFGAKKKSAPVLADAADFTPNLVLPEKPKPTKLSD